MTVSVIIPTYNGAHKILNILKALEWQTFKDFEVIVVVDGSKDNTVEILNSYQTDLKLTIAEQENQGRSRVRNNGAKIAKGDLLIFFDDDMRPNERAVEVHVKHHEAFPLTIATGAYFDDYKKATNDFLKYKCSITQNWHQSLAPWKGKPLPFSNIFLTAANCSIPKPLFIELKGFDDNLNDAEDYDMAIRASKLNISIYYLTEAFAFHDDSVSVTSYIKRLREYDMAHKKLRQLKPELYRNIDLRKPQQPRGLKRLIFSLFAQKVWLRLIERDKGLTFLPAKVRFKLYDIITSSYGTFFTERAL